MKLKYNDNFINKITGEVEERVLLGDFGNIWLSNTEYNKIEKYCSQKLDRSIHEVIDEADDYIEYRKDNIPMSYFYLKSWIDHQAQWRYE